MSTPARGQPLIPPLARTRARKATHRRPQNKKKDRPPITLVVVVVVTKRVSQPPCFRPSPTPLDCTPPIKPPPRPPPPRLGVECVCVRFFSSQKKKRMHIRSSMSRLADCVCGQDQTICVHRRGVGAEKKALSFRVVERDQMGGNARRVGDGARAVACLCSGVSDGFLFRNRGP